MGRGGPSHGREKAEALRQRLRSLQHARYNETVLDAAATGVLHDKERERILNWLRVGKTGSSIPPLTGEWAEQLAAQRPTPTPARPPGSKQKGMTKEEREAYEEDIRKKLELLVAVPGLPPAPAPAPSVMGAAKAGNQSDAVVDGEGRVEREKNDDDAEEGTDDADQEGESSAETR